MLGEEAQEGEADEAERRQAAAAQEGPVAAADREAHARRFDSHESTLHYVHYVSDKTCLLLPMARVSICLCAYLQLCRISCFCCTFGVAQTAEWGLDLRIAAMALKRHRSAALLGSCVACLCTFAWLWCHAWRTCCRHPLYTLTCDMHMANVFLWLSPCVLACCKLHYKVC